MPENIIEMLQNMQENTQLKDTTRLLYLIKKLVNRERMR